MQPISRGALYQTVPSMLGQVDLNLMQHSSFYVNSRKKSQYIFKKSSYFINTHLIFKKSSHHTTSNSLNRTSFIFLIQAQTAHHTTSNSLNRISFEILYTKPYASKALIMSITLIVNINIPGSNNTLFQMKICNFTGILKRDNIWALLLISCM